MNFTVRTDLACESMAEIGRQLSKDLYREEMRNGFRICRLRLRNKQESELLQKPIGHYITVECGTVLLRCDAELAALGDLLSHEIMEMARQLTGKRSRTEMTVLVVGLGNADLTADAIGPKTVQRLTATRHLREHEAALYQSLGCAALSAFSPGVLGQTGIETLELLKGAVEHVAPDLVVVIDALAARSCSRLASTIQLSDAGINPGAGVGNHRNPITKESLGIPVMVLGVPTVVDSATLIYDALREAGQQDVDDKLQQVLENRRSFFVSPKDSDLIVEQVSKLLAQALMQSFVGMML